jgi:hypothetical protein
VAADVPLSVTMMLADAAQAVGGKLYILGGGWSITGPDPHPSAIALYIKVPWDEADEPQSLLLELVDRSGEPHLIPTDDGMRPIRVQTVVDVSEAKANSDAEAGTELDLALALNFAPFPIPPGGSYAWRLSINGKTDESWQVPFRTRSLVSEDGDGRREASNGN